MAKHSTVKAGGPARVRLVVLDAEIPDGDLSSLTHALQNALRSPTTTVVQRVTANGGSKGIAHQPEPDDVVGEVDEEFEGAEDEQIDVTPRAAKPRSPRKPAAMPKVLDDIDIDSDPSLKSYAESANAKSNHKRYLVIASWFHLHRKIDAITADHIYTCYRHLGWPVGIADFAQPLRELKHKQFFTTPETGKYAINQLGLAQAAKLFNGRSDAAD